MSIPLGSNFLLNAQLPLDARTVVADLTARDAIVAIQRYDGLAVYCLSNNLTYQLQGGLLNANWVDISVASENFWDRAGSNLTPHNVGDSVTLGNYFDLTPSSYSGNGFILNMVTTIDPAVPGGVYVNNLTSGGLFNGYITRAFVIQIDGTPGGGFPDTFKWSKDGGSTWDYSTINISVGAMTLTEGVAITFDSQTGHTIGDNWSFSAHPYSGKLFALNDPNGLEVLRIGPTITSAIGSIGASLFDVSVGNVGGTYVSSGKQSTIGVSIFNGSMDIADGLASNGLQIFNATIYGGVGSDGSRGFFSDIYSGGLSPATQLSGYGAVVNTNAGDGAGSFMSAYTAEINKLSVLFFDSMFGPGFSTETITGTTSGASATITSSSGQRLITGAVSGGSFFVGETITGSGTGTTAVLTRVQGAGSATTAAFVILGDTGSGTGTFDYSMASIVDKLSFTTIGFIPGVGYDIEMQPGAITAGAGDVVGANIKLISGKGSGVGIDGNVDVLQSNGSSLIARFNTSTGLAVSNFITANPATVSSGTNKAISGTIASTTGAGSSYGGYFTAQGIGALNYGIYATASGATGVNNAIYSDGLLWVEATNADNTQGVFVHSITTESSKYGLQVQKIGLVTGNSYGIGVSVSGATGQTIGVDLGVSSSGTTGYGIYNLISGSVTTAYGIYSRSAGTGTNSYGVYGIANGAATTNYGVYGSASGGSTNYAGYFSGNVYTVGNISAEISGLGTTQTVGMSLINTTAAIDGSQQISPAFMFRGNGWKTDATAESEPFDFLIYCQPAQGTSAPTGTLWIQTRANNGALTTRAGLTSAGAFSCTTLIPTANTFVAIRGSVADGATAVALRVTNLNVLTTAGAKIVSFYSDNAITEKGYVTLNGGFFQDWAMNQGATVSYMALEGRNSTAAAAGAQQASPSMYLEGQGWKTNATAASQLVGIQMFILPVEGTAAPSGTFTVQSKVGAGSFTNMFTVSTAGAAIFQGTVSGSAGAATLGSRTQFGIAIQGFNASSTTIPAGVSGNMTDGASAIGVLLGSNVSLTTAGSKLISVMNSTVEKFYVDYNGSYLGQGRTLGLQGVDVTAANDITLGLGNYFDITGATEVQRILGTGWTAGSIVRLQFDSNPNVKHGQAAGSSYFGFQLAGAADFAATVGNTLTLAFDGAWWRELARTVI